MPGIEPGSERLDPQVSTSVAGRICHPGDHDRQRCTPGQPLGPESPSFIQLAAWLYGTPALCRPSCHRQESGTGGRGPTGGPGLIHSLPKQREAERKQSCDWHLFFALSYRGRRLSARNLGSASSVEACHPQSGILYTNRKEGLHCF